LTREAVRERQLGTVPKELRRSGQQTREGASAPVLHRGLGASAARQQGHSWLCVGASGALLSQPGRALGRGIAVMD
jgi:hypothetical protein